MDLPLEPLQEFYVIFSHSKDWLRHFLKQGFSHVSVLTKDDYNWIWLNPERLILRTTILPVPSHETPFHLIKEDCAILKIVFYPRHTTQTFGYFGFFHCLVVAKYLLGLKLRALTPYRLFKKLLTLSDKERARLRIHSITLMEGA